MKLKFSRQIFVQSSNISFYETRPVEGDLSHADGQIDLRKPAVVTCRSFGNTYKMSLRTRRGIWKVPKPHFGFKKGEKSLNGPVKHNLKQEIN